MNKFSQSRNRCIALAMAIKKEPWLKIQAKYSRATGKIFQLSLNNGEMITLKTSMLTAHRPAINHDGKIVMRCVKMQTIVGSKDVSYRIFLIKSQWKPVAPLFHKCLWAKCISCRVRALYVKSQIWSVRTSVEFLSVSTHYTRAATYTAKTLWAEILNVFP